MRGLVLIPVLVLLLTLQSVLAPRVEVWGARADWLLVVVTYLGLFAPRREAVVIAWAIGLGADLLTVERLGLLSMSYGTAAISVASIREYVYRRQAWTQFGVTLAAGFLVRTVWFVYAGLMYDGGGAVLGTLGRDVLLGSLYTAAWAPLVHQGLVLLGRLGSRRERHEAAIYV